MVLMLTMNDCQTPLTIPFDKMHLAIADGLLQTSWFPLGCVLIAEFTKACEIDMQDVATTFWNKKIRPPSWIPGPIACEQFPATPN